MLGRLFCFLETDFGARDALHRETGSMTDNDFTRDVIRVIVQFICQPERYDDTADVPVGNTEAHGRFIQSDRVPLLYTSATAGLAHISTPDVLGTYQA